MKIEHNDLYKVVLELNGDLWDKNSKLIEQQAYAFIAHDTGFCQSVTFGNIVLWDSENDGRVWIEKENRPEDLIGYLRRQFNLLVGNLAELMFDLKETSECSVLANP